MIDHLVGRPSPSWKRLQVFLVIFFWLWRITRGASGPPRLLWLKSINRFLKRFTPWQIIVSTLTAVYAVRNFDNILGLCAPEPLANLYSPSYYRATWITTGLDAGFATAMSIRPKWLRDICSFVFSAYYIIYANEADEKLRRFRAVPTVEMLRYTWEKTSNPYLRLFTNLPSLTTRKKVLLPRPKSSTYRRPITGFLYYAYPLSLLKECDELILDFPGGGFVAMSPDHHEERLRIWALNTSKPVLAIDYGKAPEYPYPFAIDEAFDAFQVLVESGGSVIGMSGKKLKVVLAGDSAGASMAVNVVFKVLEYNESHASRGALSLPLALALSYAALDFNFTSWMTQDNLRVLRAEQSTGNLPGIKELAAQKDHLKHISPLSMVGDRPPSGTRPKKPRRHNSWKETLRGFTTSGSEKDEKYPETHSLTRRRSTSGLKTPIRRRTFLREPKDKEVASGSDADEEEDFTHQREEDWPLQARVKFVYPHSTPVSAWTEAVTDKEQERLSAAVVEADTNAAREKVGKDLSQRKKDPIGVRLTMTSRTGYFQDRIISPSMMRAMAILYIGPHRNPDFATDYHLSPILAPNHLLAQFPPLLMQCGEKDPFVDDTVIFAGRVREAKRARKAELDLAISGKSARFGKNVSAPDAGPADLTPLIALKRERNKLASETDEDWVQLVLFAEWSHGYLQMAALMAEARVVIEDLGDWIDDAFSRLGGNGEDKAPTSEHRHTKAGSSPRPTSNGRATSPLTSETETDDFGITFVAKKHQRTGRSSNAGSIDVESERTSGTTVDFGQTIRTGAAETGKRRGHGEEHTGDSNGVPDEEEHGGGSEGIKASGSRQGGQKISESELMRRRRLLDSHIFE